MNGKLFFFIAVIAFMVFAFREITRIDEKIYKDHNAAIEKYARENNLPPYVTITRIHGCEYLESGSGYSFSRCHKGDCDNPIHYKNKD